MTAVQQIATPKDVADLITRIEALERNSRKNVGTIMVTTNNLELLITAFTIASGAAAMGLEITMFFNFWGVTALTKKRRFKNKTLKQKMLAMMIPSNIAGCSLRKMHMFGIGKKMMDSMMKQHNVSGAQELIDVCLSMGVRIIACQTTAKLMGLTAEDFIEGVEVGGIAKMMKDSLDSKFSYVIS